MTRLHKSTQSTYLTKTAMSAVATVLLCLTTSHVTAEQVASLQQRAQRAIAASDYAEAIAVLSEWIAEAPTSHDAYYLRGREHFRAGHVKQSFDDFEKVVELRPALKPRLWERGITCYYAGEFQRGIEQFNAYQGFDDNDVENAVWHFLCLARQTNVAKAREKILRTKPDPRVPMQAVYQLYAGQLEVDGVLEAAIKAPAGTQRKHALFYAHLYIGLYYEITQEPALARKHIERAATEYRISHYMGDVARIHAQLLKIANE